MRPRAALSLLEPPPPVAAEGPVALAAGRLHEAFSGAGAGAAPRAFLFGAAQALRPRLLVWAREAIAGMEAGELYGPGLAGFHADLAAILVVEARRRIEALWAAEECLKQAGAAVLLDLGARGRPLDLTATRRLALAAESHGSTALVLRGDFGANAAPPSAAWTRWRVAPAASRTPWRDQLGPLTLEAALMRHRGGARPQRFFLEWGDGAFHAEAVGLDLAAPAFDRSAEAAAVA